MSHNIDTMLSAFLLDYASKLHVRGIARRIGMNRQTVSQGLREMEKSGILVSSVSGRHKLYSLNTGTITKLHVQGAENAKRILACRKNPAIKRLVEYLPPGQVFLLFGSYAKGLQKKGSDIDMLVIGKPKNLTTFEKETGKDVQVFPFSEKSFLQAFHSKDPLVLEALGSHVCLSGIEPFVSIMWRANYGH